MPLQGNLFLTEAKVDEVEKCRADAEARAIAAEEAREAMETLNGASREIVTKFRRLREILQVFGSFFAFSEVFGCVRIRSDPFGCVRIHSDAFGCIRKFREIFGSFRKKSVFDDSERFRRFLEVFGRVRTHSDAFGSFWKLWKISCFLICFEKFRNFTTSVKGQPPFWTINDHVLATGLG